MKRFFGANSKLLVSILTLFCIVMVGGTLAYLFATSDLVSNMFSSAVLETEIDEPKNGLSSDKTVTIKNTGESPAWIRARLLVSGIDPANVQIANNEDEAKLFAANDENSQKIYLVIPVTAWEVQNATGTWGVPTAYSDDWFYYTKVLDGKTGDDVDATTALLDGVIFGSGVDPNTITITVTHESVLAINTDPEDDEPWVTAFNNPAGSVPSPTPTT